MLLPAFSAPSIGTWPRDPSFPLQGRMAHMPLGLAGANPREGPGATHQGEGSGSNQQIAQVSREFEALMLSFVFKAMRQTIPKSDFLGKARNQDWYTDLFDFELAKSFTQRKSIGLSAYLQQDLHRLQHQQAPPRHAAGSELRTPPKSIHMTLVHCGCRRPKVDGI